MLVALVAARLSLRSRGVPLSKKIPAGVALRRAGHMAATTSAPVHVPVLLKVAPTHSGNTPDHHGRLTPKPLPVTGRKDLASQAFGAKSALGTGSERV